MTHFYSDIVSKEYGKNPGKGYSRGAYITPDGTISELKSSPIGDSIFKFWLEYVYPSEEEIRFAKKEEYLQYLINLEASIRTKNYKFDEPIKARQMKLYLARYLINVYKSENMIWDKWNRFVDFSSVTGISNETYMHDRYCMLKDILVQACNYDSIESQLYRSITTSKFSIYETFYDYILHDYKIYQIPKKVYDEELQRYVDYVQPEWMISDRELRLKDELESICRNVPLEERGQYVRNKTCDKKMADFLE